MIPLTQKTKEEMALFLSTLVGRSEQEVTNEVTTNQGITRIILEDDRPYMLTCDYKLNRINLEINGGVVTKAEVG